jgi:ribokinase
MNIDLVIAGSIGLDDVETPFGKVKDSLGGSCIYASCAASFFVQPGIVGVAGTDFPESAKKLLASRKVDTTGLTLKGKTFRWSGLYEYDMNEAKTLKTELNSLADFKPVLPANYLSSKVLFLANIDPDLQLEVIEQLKGKSFIILDTMNYWISSKKESLLKVINLADMVVINEGEARQLFETPNLIQAGRELLKLGPKYAVIKKGEHGALLFSKDKFFSAPSFPLEVVKDPTGAGDSFAGGLAGYLAKTGDFSEKNVRKAMIYGSAVASFCAEDFSLNYLEKNTNNDVEERFHVFEEIRKF